MSRSRLSRRSRRTPGLPGLNALALCLCVALTGAPPTAASPRADEETGTLLLQSPTVSAEHVVFVYAADLWIVSRAGGDARRLTSSPGGEGSPRLSPDGSLVAFTGEYGGNADVYVVPVTGGTPRRLTWHGGADVVVDWHPDGEHVLFRSRRASGDPVNRVFLAALDAEQHGGTPAAVELPRVYHASFDADASHIAYTPYADAFRSWKRYRGGRVTPIWLFDRSTHEVEVVPHVNASDTYPQMLDGVVYFGSDRDGTMDLYRYRPGTGPSQESIEQLTQFDDYDIRSLDAGAGVLVFDQGGAIHEYDPGTGEVRTLVIHVRDDGLAALPRWQPVRGHVRGASVAPNGRRAVFEARGEILTVPREHGSPRNLTNSPGVHDRAPTWSPDGKSIAWFHDGAGEYGLVVRDLEDGSERTFDLGTGTFFYEASWSPDGEHVLVRDKTNRLTIVTLESGALTEVVTNQGSLGVVGTEAVWSPDSAWIAYEHRDPETLYDSIALYEVASGTSTIVTDGFAAAGSPSFSPDGDLLYFAASVDVGPNLFGLDMSTSASRDWDANLYVLVLKADGEHPLAPRSDEGFDGEDGSDEDGSDEDGEDDAESEDDSDGEEGDASEEGGEEGDSSDDDEADDAEDSDEPEEPSIDLEGIDQRILALPAGNGQLANLVGVEGGLLYLRFEDDGPALRKFDLAEREDEQVRAGVGGFSVSHDGKSLLFSEGGGFHLAGLDASKPDRLDVDGVRVWVDPSEEWPQTLREVWRIQRDYFYDPAMHGVDWEAAWERHARFLPHLRHRRDLTFLIQELIGELACGHQYAYGGELPDGPDGPSVGLLGADWTVDAGRYRIETILQGQNWNPSLRAPLTQPGVDAREGDYLLRVEGREVTASDNLYRAFEDLAGRKITIALSDAAEGGEVREVEVVPIGNEGALRQLSWIESNRRRVDEKSGGRLAYVYMPNTGGPGREAFDRDFYSQLDKQGLVLDERFNGGGQVADYVIDVLSREVRSYWMNREGWLGRSPFGLLEGPKVMVINERAGSGGDWMPWAFRNAGLGPLVGTRTWGGLVGISGYPPLMDGGTVTAASFGVMDPEGNWAVENVGVAPDVEVIQWPREILAGNDPQLDRAIELALEALAQQPQADAPGYVPPSVR